MRIRNKRPDPPPAEPVKGAVGATGDRGEKGDRGERGEAGDRGEAGRDGIEGKAGARGLTGRTGDTGATGKAGETGARGQRGPKGERGPEGPTGPAPEHEWEGTKLRFQQPDGEWGESVDLKGPKGDPGQTGVVRVGATAGGTGAQQVYVLADAGDPSPAYPGVPLVVYRPTGAPDTYTMELITS